MRSLVVERRMLPKKDVHMLTPGTCEYVTAHGKGDFADAITVKHLEKKRLSSYAGGPGKALRGGRQEQQSGTRRCEDAAPLAPGRRPQPRKAGGL